MSNKIKLQTNNEALDTLITRVNAAKDTAASLPIAGGGGSIETFTGTIEIVSPLGSGAHIVYYINENFEVVSGYSREFNAITIAAGTFIVINNQWPKDLSLSNVTNVTHFNETSNGEYISVLLPTANNFYISNQ